MVPKQRPGPEASYKLTMDALQGRLPPRERDLLEGAASFFRAEKPGATSLDLLRYVRQAHDLVLAARKKHGFTEETPGFGQLLDEIKRLHQAGQR